MEEGLGYVRYYRTEWGKAVTCNSLGFATKGLRRCMTTITPKVCPARWPTNCASCCSRLKQPDSLDQVARFPGWKLHPLKGDLKGFWSLTVSGNWRLIFTYEETTNTADDIDLIDYH